MSSDNVTPIDGKAAATPEVITSGAYAFEAKCPECEQVVRFPIELYPRFSADQHGSKLRVVMSSKTLEHDCAAEATEPMF